MDKYVTGLEDALDHIMKVAGQARRPTRRLDWISARARGALQGKEYRQEDMPQYPRTGTKKAPVKEPSP